MPQSIRFGICEELRDGDVLLVMIDQADKDKPIDLAIRGGELIQQIISRRRCDAIESHVMIFTDLRPPGATDQVSMPKRKPSAGTQFTDVPFPHVIHFEPAGLVGSPLLNSINRHSEELLVMRCNNRQLARCASQVAVELFLNATLNYYNWMHYVKIGIAYGKKAVSEMCLAKAQSEAVVAMDAGGLAGLLASMSTYLNPTTLSCLGLGKLIDWWTSETQYTQQPTLEMGIQGTVAHYTKRYLPSSLQVDYPEFNLFWQFHKYYDIRTGQLVGNLTVAEVCSSFVILCYQLAYIKLVRYFNLVPLRTLGPRRIQSPTGMRELFCESNLFDTVGCINAAYQAENPTSAEHREAYATRYRDLLVRKAAEFSISNKAGRSAEAPW